MRTLVTTLAAVLFAGAASAAPQLNQPAPAFKLAGSDGKQHSLADYKGKYVVLEWTNHECPFVKKHYAGNMQMLQKDLTRKGAVWLSIVSSAPGKQGAVDAAKATELTLARGAAPTVVLLDPNGEAGRAYEAKTTPHMYIVAPDGKLIYMGGIDSIPSSDAADIPKATQYVQVALTEAMAGKPVTNASTRPYGCSVKY
ncbi:MAG TPA: redoxin domain-containing protein [Verrucomicrobiae bacterium]|nr:redoxin domain-containing protein [Verrucomicrobiae bacterium]